MSPTANNKRHRPSVAGQPRSRRGPTAPDRGNGWLKLLAGPKFIAVAAVGVLVTALTTGLLVRLQNEVGADIHFVVQDGEPTEASVVFPPSVPRDYIRQQALGNRNFLAEEAVRNKRSRPMNRPSRSSPREPVRTAS